MNPRFALTRLAWMIRVGFVLAAVATGLLLAGSAQAATVQKASAGSPEHVADAFAALKAGGSSVAKQGLSTAIATSGEPKMARMHAKEALGALNQGKLAMARGHAENGAAVEHFAYALRALKQGKAAADATARGHLNEAVALAPYKKYAKAALSALSALTRHDRTTAKAKTRQGLNAAVMAA